LHKRRLTVAALGINGSREPLGLPGPRQQPLELVRLGPARDHALEHVGQPRQGDYTGRITRRGDGMLRTLLFEAASSLITRAGGGGALREWAVRLRARVGHKKASVALARKLGVILHRMWADGTAFRAA
jgi:hypothetical protein